MVLLSKPYLIRMVKSHILVIEPFDEEAVKEAFIELKLGNKFTALVSDSGSYIDPVKRITPLRQKDMLDDEPPIRSEKKYEVINVPDDGKFLIEPLEYVLGQTREFITIPEGYVGILHGKSTLGRLGLQLFYAGGYIDPKFQGHCTLEIFNANKIPIALRPGMIIAKLSLQALTKPPAEEEKKEEEGEKLTEWVEKEKTEEKKD